MVNLGIKWKTKHGGGKTTICIPTKEFEIFSHFPKAPYKEEPEFSGNLVIGSAGINYKSKGKQQTTQIIFRLDPGHKQGQKKQHINQDLGITKPNKEKRTRMKTPLDHTIKMAPEIELTVVNLETKKTISKETIKLLQKKS